MQPAAKEPARVIVRPDVPPAYGGLLTDPARALGPPRYVAGFLAGVLTSGAALLIPHVGVLLAAAGALVSIAGAAYPWVRYRNAVVGPPGWIYSGVAIRGAALEMLQDIYDRFDYARTMVAQVPTGLRWSEVDGEVRTLLWEAAGTAATVAALDVEIGQMRYADAGTPQAAMLARLRDERSARWDLLVDVQWEAEALARQAGNAVAAAHLALAVTGSVAALRVVVPSQAALRAKGALAEARARLALLAEVWASLDETGAIADETMRAALERGDDPPAR